MKGSEIQAGTHVCVFHAGARQRRQRLLEVVREGFESGDRCICVVRPDDALAIVDRFSSAGLHGVGGVVAMPPARARELVRAEGRGVGLRAGHPSGGTRIVTDLTWLAQRGGPAMPEPELSQLVANGEHLAVCLRDLESLEARELVDLCRAHSRVHLGRRPFVPARMVGGSAAANPIGSRDHIFAAAALMPLADEAREVGALTSMIVGALDRARLYGLVLKDQRHQLGQWLLAVDAHSVIDAELQQLGSLDGPITLPDEPWSWAFSLPGRGGAIGHLVVGGDEEPSAEVFFALQLVARQAGAALAHLRTVERKRTLRRELQRTRTTLANTAELLEWNTVARERLHQVVVDRGGPDGIATALHDMTGQTIEIHDVEGRSWACAGSEGVDAGRDLRSAEREELLRRATRADRAFWHGRDLVAVARVGGQVVGLVRMVEADPELGEGELVALQDAAVLAGLEIAHLREVAEIEVRLGRDLVNELLDGRDPRALLDRARALGSVPEHDHRVVLVEPRESTDLEEFFHAVRRAARDVGAGPLLTTRRGRVVVLADEAVRWDRLRAAVVAEPGGGDCRIGLGGSCKRLTGVPAALRQARLALRLSTVARADDSVIDFDQLGIYQVLAELVEGGNVERYVEEWLQPLQPLLDYDDRHHSELVDTLSEFVESGARHDPTARALKVHRSTLKYRLQRIREITGWDLTDPEHLFRLQLATRALRTLSALRR